MVADLLGSCVVSVTEGFNVFGLLAQNGAFGGGDPLSALTAIFSFLPFIDQLAKNAQDPNRGLFDFSAPPPPPAETGGSASGLQSPNPSSPVSFGTPSKEGVGQIRRNVADRRLQDRGGAAGGNPGRGLPDKGIQGAPNTLEALGIFTAKEGDPLFIPSSIIREEFFNEPTATFALLQGFGVDPLEPDAFTKQLPAIIQSRWQAALGIAGGDIELAKTIFRTQVTDARLRGSEGFGADDSGSGDASFQAQLEQFLGPFLQSLTQTQPTDQNPEVLAATPVIDPRLTFFSNTSQESFF